MSAPRQHPDLAAALASLAGGGLDLDELAREAESSEPLRELIALLATLWELPVAAVPPASVFAAEWPHPDEG